MKSLENLPSPSSFFASILQVRQAASAALASVCLLAALSAHAGPLPHLTDFKPVGSGTLRFFGLAIYDATLWSPGGVWSAGKPFALELRYARSFDSASIARRTIDEIRAQHAASGATLTRWEQQLRSIFPDVKSGDRLTGVRLPGQGVAFYSAASKLGQIDDETFAEAFFNIWLHPATRAPELRTRLLGNS